jgi:uncharacterized protein (TIGR04255 family)
MGVPLKNPPVYLTLAQVRFNPILTLAEFLPGIQESFRRSGFPDFERQNVVSFQVVMNDAQSVPTPLVQDRFQFGNVDKTHIFILDGHTLALQSTDYGHFQAFSTCFMTGLGIVNDAVKLAFTERIGLRYLDRVMPQDGEKLEQYLESQVHGISSRLAGKSLYSYTEALNEVEKIKLLSRVVIQDGPLAFPPDLQPGNMQIAQRFATYTGRSAIIDNDGFVEMREPFNSDTVATHLDAIHNVIGTAFKTTATPFALAAWDK